MTVAGTLLTVFCVAGFLSTLIWPARARRGQADENVPAGIPLRGARWCAGGASLLYLAVIAGAFLQAGDPAASPATGGDGAFLFVLLLLSRFAIIATVGAIAYSGLLWWYRIWPLLHRLHYTAVTILLVVFTVWLAFFDLAGWYP